MTDAPFDADAFNAFEAAGWEQRARAYHRFLAPITARVINALFEAAGLQPGHRVLDIGTGPGDAAAAAAVRGATAVGVDVAEAMLALARAAHPGVEFHRAGAEDLPFEPGSFDVVVGNFVILHVGRPEAAAAELARVLARGGRVALSTWDSPDRAAFPGVYARAVVEAGADPPPDVPGGPGFFRFADDAEFARLLEGAGLEDVSVRTESFDLVVAGAEELWSGVVEGTVRTRAVILAQPPEVKARIRAAFDRLVAQYDSGPGRGLRLPVSVKVASARKPTA